MQSDLWAVTAASLNTNMVIIQISTVHQIFAGDGVYMIGSTLRQGTPVQINDLINPCELLGF